MQFLTASLLTLASVAALVSASPAPFQGLTHIDRRLPTHIDARLSNGTIAKRETSFGDPDRVADQGDRYQINYGSTEGHENACPGHYICYIFKNGSPKDEIDLGDPDNFVDEGDRYRLNYGSRDGHPNACDGHFICYLYK